MARGRFISDSVATDTRLNSLSVEAHLAYLMTIPHLDRDGLIEGDPDVLWGTVCPKRRQFLDRMATFIQEWARAGLVQMYDTSNGPVLWFRGFAKNQVGMRYDREAQSKFPPPPSGNIPDAIQSSADELRTNSGICRAEVEVKDQVEVKVQDAATQRGALDIEVVFDSPAQPTTLTKSKALTPQQEMYGAICEALGWDYHVIAEKEKVRVAQAVKILSKSDYCVEDIRRFMVEVWFKDWRWEKHQQYPTLEQLRQEIGKLRSLVPAAAPPPKAKGLDSWKRLAANIGATT